MNVEKLLCWLCTVATKKKTGVVTTYAANDLPASPPTIDCKSVAKLVPGREASQIIYTTTFATDCTNSRSMRHSRNRLLVQYLTTGFKPHTKSDSTVLSNQLYRLLSPMDTLELSDAAELLSTRGYDAQSSRSWFKIIEIISDVYDEKTNPGGYISMGIAENVCLWNLSRIPMDLT